MNIIGVGVDIVDIRRVRAARFLARMAEFFFLPHEVQLMEASRDPSQFVASRLAAKEAVIKAYPSPLHYHDFMIVADPAPVVQFINPAHQHKVHVSLAHEHDYAISYATVCQ